MSRSLRILTLVLVAGLLNATTAAAGRTLPVRPALGGPQSTFRVIFNPGVLPPTGMYRVSVRSSCGGSPSSYPWLSTVPMVGSPHVKTAGALQLPRPVGGGWCAGTYQGKVVELLNPRTHTIGTFSFVVRRGVRTRLPERPCRPRGSTTVLETREGRIFNIRLGPDIVLTEGCLFDVRGHMSLVNSLNPFDPESESLVTAALTAPYAAYLIKIAGAADYQWDLQVTDLRNGEPVHRASDVCSAAKKLTVSRVGQALLTCTDGTLYKLG